MAANAALLLAVIGFVLRTPNTSQAIKQSALTSDVVAASPLDQLSSSDIAVHLALMASLPESTAVVNQADTISGQLATSSADSRVVAKPQIISTASKSYKDIQVYVTKRGDTLAKVAARFGVTSDSIRWSNNIESNELPSRRELYIPPVNGIVYLVKAGDTSAKLARTYSANKAAIDAFNDAEVSGLVVGRRIVIPDGTKASAVLNVATFGGGGVAWGGAAIYGHNGYDYGWCTWYAANKIEVPANWGNANTWDNYAPSSGWTVSGAPRPGAVAQTDAGGWGHVGVVEAVSEDGTMIKYSDMNGLAGWGATGYSGWEPAHNKFQKFIYR
ncbi:MAG TPA: CHAP domain-containing protein [Candidatus Limnocylindria bacterium]|nr:CHAP domain-containing protein [Candidatus Limnocylindria bacterium]